MLFYTNSYIKLYQITANEKVHKVNNLPLHHQ